MCEFNIYALHFHNVKTTFCSTAFCQTFIKRHPLSLYSLVCLIFLQQSSTLKHHCIGSKHKPSIDLLFLAVLVMGVLQVCIVKRRILTTTSNNNRSLLHFVKIPSENCTMN